MTGTEGVHSTKALNFLVFACTLYCFQSFNVWFLWGSTIKIIALLLCVFSIFYNRSYNNVFNKFRAQHLFIAVFFAIVSINAANSESIISLVKSFLDIYIIANVITLKKEVLKKQFSVITTVFAIISLISLLGWLVYLFDPELLPHTSIQSKDLGYRFDNYYIFLRGVSILPRFCSVFLEPGHYILISCPILFINKFNIRDKRILIILVASIFAFSLAFFLVCIFALICFNHIVRSIFLYVFIFIIGAIAVPQIQKINGGDNIVNQLIIMRLQVDDDKGLSGNNRNSDDFNRYYNKFLKSDKVYFGD